MGVEPHKKWLIDNGLGDYLEERPSSIGSDICKLYSDADKGICLSGCPFYVECTPYFKELAKELEKKIEPVGGKK